MSSSFPVSYVAPSERMLLWCSMAMLLWSGAASAAVVQALPADAVIDSLGVNVHLGYGDTVYGQEFDAIIRPKLLALGVRHLRDGAHREGSIAQRQRDLCTNGLRLTLICDPRQDWLANPTPAMLKEIATAAGPGLAALEGPNEFDARGQAEWNTTLRDYCRRLKQAASSEPTTAHLPVIGPSLIQAGSYTALGDCSDFVDGSNLHHYLGGHHPGTTGWGDDHYGSLEWIVRRAARVQAPGKPIYVTEFGFHNAIHQDGGHLPTSERAAGAYLVRQWLGNVLNGVTRSFAYEFIDGFANDDLNNAECHFGLLRHDGSEKPSYRVIKTVLGELRDAGPKATATAGRLALDVQGGDGATRQVLAQKRDGTWILVLWQEVPSWDPDRRIDIEVPLRLLSLHLGSSITEAEVVTFADDGEPSRSQWHGGSSPLVLSVWSQITLVRMPGNQHRSVGDTPLPSPLAVHAAAPASGPVRPASAVASEWGDRLFKQVCAKLAHGYEPRFRLGLVSAQVRLAAATPSGDLTLRHGDTSLTYVWSLIDDHERLDLALDIQRDDSSVDLSVVAFYALVVGDQQQAQAALVRLDPAEAARIKASIGEQTGLK